MAEEKKNGKQVKEWGAYELAMNLGFMIVTPVLVFGIGGVMLDKKLDTFPLFVFVGFILSMVAALTIVFVKTKDIIIAVKKKEPKTPKESQDIKKKNKQ